MPELARKRQTESGCRTRDETVLLPCSEERFEFCEQVNLILFLEKRRVEIAVFDLIAEFTVHTVRIRLLTHELKGLYALLHHLLIRRKAPVVAPHERTDEAARTRAEGKDIAPALGERIVKAALAGIGRPMRRVDAPYHRVLRDDFKSALEILRLFLRCREHGQIPRLDAVCQLARREYVELIEVAARNPDLELRAHIVLPDLHGLIRQSVDEIGNDDSALLLHHAAQRLNDCLTVVDASDRLTDARVKGLHAEGETVDPCIHRRLNLALGEVVNAPLKRDLAVARERQTFAHRTHETREIGIAECRRRTSAKEYRMEGRPRHIGRIGRRLDLLHEHIDIVMRRLFARKVLEEAAIAAFLITERDVDVNRTFIGRVWCLRHQSCPDVHLLRLVSDHALAARTGMHHTLLRKGAAERILRLRAKQPTTRLL